MTREQRAVEAIHRGRLTTLQRQALAALLQAVGTSDPVCEPLATIYGSALDALAPDRPEAADQPGE